MVDTLRRPIVLFLLLLLLPLVSTGRADIARLDIDGAIDPITAEFVIKGLDRAESERAEMLLIRLQTPGGLATSMEDIVTRILNSKVPVVVYVAPSGAKAASAGFF